MAPADAAGAEQVEWLLQAKKVRDEAIGLLRERCARDLELAAELLEGRKTEALVIEIEYASKLTRDYLAESEKLFEITRRLVQH
jgi:hypothetical protein